jgi:putative ATP-binding cassette transporter
LRFFQLLAHGSRRTRWRIFAYMMLGGTGMAAMAAIVTTVADANLGEVIRYELLFAFGLAAVAVITFNTLSQNLTLDFCENVLERLRVRLSDLVRGADLDKLERIGQTSIYDSIARNSTLVSESAPIIIHATTSGIALVLAALYITLLSWFAFVVICLLFVVLGYSYYFGQRRSRQAFVAARAAESRFFSLLGHLLWGFKEVKMSSRRGDDLETGYIAPQSVHVEDLKIIAGREFNKGIIASYAVFYFLLGTVTFALPQHLPSTAIAVKVVYMVVFMLSTLEVVLKGLPLISKVDVALDQLEQMERELVAAGHRQETAATEAGPGFKEIELRGVIFSHHAPDGSPTFTVGPCDLVLHPGETIFFIGGNGSGKSTLLRVIARLYEPSAGSVVWDGHAVDYGRVADYRNLFATVFADFHLFDRLYGFAERDPEHVNALLVDYGLGKSLQYVDGAFSNTDLSTGQRKRLALVVCLLEDKPILILDELAADQDPSFRQRYYEEILPALREQGRTILAASHDERYFSVADRIMKMEDGKLTDEKRVR